MEKRGQISVEYMTVIGFVTIITISLFLIAQYQAKQVDRIANLNQVDAIARDIISEAETVYYFGAPSKSTITIFMPKGVNNITIHPDEISISIRTSSGMTDIAHLSAVPLQGNISTAWGLKSISVEAREGYVWVNGT